jgi:hypothetical protein
MCVTDDVIDDMADRIAAFVDQHPGPAEAQANQESARRARRRTPPPPPINASRARTHA